jgi:uncharacterized protein (DUF2235 family)
MDEVVAPKNIILCSDGTGNQDIKERGTNVFKLYEAVDLQGHKSKPDLIPQVAFYDDGLGTSSLTLLKFIGGAFGWGFSHNIRDLYTELIHVYQPGDRLYLFGFSRGAYTVRALAGLIQYSGILDVDKFDAPELRLQVRKCLQDFKAVAFRHLKSDSERRCRIPVLELREEAIRRRAAYGAIMHPEYAPGGEIKIEFIGVWDTVGAVGVPFDWLKNLLSRIGPVRFSDLTLGSHVKTACHALSIDDERRTFYPELWNEQHGKDTRINQVWFAGAHSNVGGGYPKQGMSLVALDWMMAQAEHQGLRFIHNDREYVNSHQDVHGNLYDSRAGLSVYYRWSPRNLPRLCAEHNIEKAKVHVSVIERIANGTNGYAPGNIPFDCEIVATPARPTWPPPSTLQALSSQIQSGAPRDARIRSPLDAMAKFVVIGKLSYYAFLAMTALAIWLLCQAPELLTGRDPEAGFRLSQASWVWGCFIVAGVLIRTWSGLVDSALTAEYAGCWHRHRDALRKLIRQVQIHP